MALLILPQQHDYSIEAEARTDGEQIVLHYGASVDPAVPESIIRYVMRTQERVIVDDATNQNLFSGKLVLRGVAREIDPLPSAH